MGDTIRRGINPRTLVAVIVVLLVGVIGTYLLARSNAQSVENASRAPAGLLTPVSLGIVPYQYIAYSGSLDQSRQATGVKDYVASFVIASDACKPSWGGSVMGEMGGTRAAEIQADLTALRAAGGDATISFGGAIGTELASVCASTTELTAAYRKVISTYQASRVDFDIEGPALADAAGNQRRAVAIANLQKSDPDLRVWITLPVHTQGLTSDGQEVLKELIRQDVKISGVNIMAMNYNVRSRDMGKQAVDSAKMTASQLRGLYPNESGEDIWKALGITVMIGHNNTVGEIFTLEDAAEVKSFAASRGVGMLSQWSVGRDMACPDPATPQPSIGCSGVAQQPYDFLKALTIPAVD